MPAAEITEFGWYTNEIKRMMFGFGDVAFPNQETAELIEKIVKDQLICLLNLLSEVVAKTDTKKVGIKEYLLLLRHHPVKLRRFCQYIQATDFKKIADTAEDDSASSEFMLSDKTESKNLNAALNFLHFLDPSGFLSSAADPTKISTMLDESLVERNQRIDAMTQGMDIEQYLDYTKKKCVSFKRRQPLNKFQDWLLHNSAFDLDFAMSSFSWDLLSYFAYETVAQIVDLAFIVRRDNVASIDDVQRNTVPRLSPMNADLNKPTWSNSTQPLTVAEVMEAMRRFNNNLNSVCTPFTRNKSTSSRKLLAL